MSQHSYDCQCQLDLHKTVLFCDDKLVKTSLKHEEDYHEFLTAESTIPVQHITLKLDGKKAAEAFLYNSKKKTPGGLSVLRNTLKVAAL